MEEEEEEDTCALAFSLLILIEARGCFPFSQLVCKYRSQIAKGVHVINKARTRRKNTPTRGKAKIQDSRVVM